MFKKLLKGVNKRKVKVFSLFLICSFLAWFLSNLSESYESRANFSLNYKSLPDTLLLGNNSVNFLETRIKTSGFQHLYYKIFNKNVDIDLSETGYDDGKYYLAEDVLKKQIQGQLPQNISLIDVYGDPLPVDLYQVVRKEVPIRAVLDIDFRQNFILDGEAGINPETLVVKGPPNEVDTLRQVFTTMVELSDVSSDFSQDASLILPKSMTNSVFSISRVKVSGKVVKFSEKVFEIPVGVTNLPEGYQIKTFPNVVSVLCQATVEQLKDMDSGDFEISADYRQLNNPSDNVLFLQLTRKPEKSYGVRLLENKVNFVLEQK